MCTKLFWIKCTPVAIVAVLVVSCTAALVGLGVRLLPGASSPLQQGAIVTNGHPCASIGKDILMKQGSAVEAAIAALFCEGVVSPHLMGLGGSFLMTIYKRDSGKVEVLNAHVRAPSAATKDMFQGNLSISTHGGLAVAVPGELMGYWEAYQKYKSGNIEWKDLVQPTIDLCNNIPVSDHLAQRIKYFEETIRNSPTLRDILINNKTNSILKEGDKFQRLKLAETLKIIRDKSAMALYNGELTDNFVNDIKDLNGIITKKDMNEYSVSWEEPIVANLKNNIKMYSVRPPGSGAVLAFIMNVLNDFVHDENNITTYQRIIETFKYAYGKRMQLGDPAFVSVEETIQQLLSENYADSVRKNISDCKTWLDATHYGATEVLAEDHGTGHLAVLAPNGDAVSVTSTMNLAFGAMVRSTRTGIILNCAMHDFTAPNISSIFDLPPSQNNYIEGNKHPMSSMSPSIFVDGNGDVQLVIGAGGGARIITATALVAMRVLWFHISLKEAIEAPRFNHQLLPMYIEYEKEFSCKIIKELEHIGHVTRLKDPMRAAVNGIAREHGNISAVYDFRRKGGAELFEVSD